MAWKEEDLFLLAPFFVLNPLSSGSVSKDVELLFCLLPIKNLSTRKLNTPKPSTVPQNDTFFDIPFLSNAILHIVDPMSDTKYLLEKEIFVKKNSENEKTSSTKNQNRNEKPIIYFLKELTMNMSTIRC